MVPPVHYPPPRLPADIQQKDREVLELLQERVTLFSDLAEVTGGQEVTLPANCRNIFRAETPQAPQGEKLLMDAIVEGTTGGGVTDVVCCAALACNHKRIRDLLLKSDRLLLNNWEISRFICSNSASLHQLTD